MVSFLRPDIISRLEFVGGSVARGGREVFAGARTSGLRLRHVGTIFVSSGGSIVLAEQE